MIGESFDIPSNELYHLVREKTHIMLFLEIMVRRLDIHVLKVKINAALGYPEDSNELIRYLTKTANSFKSTPVPGFSNKCK